MNPTTPITIVSNHRGRTIETTVTARACGELVTNALDNPHVREIRLSFTDGQINAYRLA